MNESSFFKKKEITLLDVYKDKYLKAYEVIDESGNRNVILENEEESILINASDYDGSSNLVFGTKWMDNYSDYKRYNKNGYIVVLYKGHPKSFNGLGNAAHDISYCVYEHVLIAEDIISRSLRNDEVVHHLDSHKANNIPENLLIISSEMHGKLHSWLSRYNFTPIYEKSVYSSECNRCANCEKPCSVNLKYCSARCANINTIRESKMPDKDTLDNLIRTMSMVSIGKIYEVSDVTIKNWCVKLNIDLTNRKNTYSGYRIAKELKKSGDTALKYKKEILTRDQVSES